MYTRSGDAPVGTITPNPSTGKIQTIVVERGSAPQGEAAPRPNTRAMKRPFAAREHMEGYFKVASARLRRF